MAAVEFLLSVKQLPSGEVQNQQYKKAFGTSVLLCITVLTSRAQILSTVLPQVADATTVSPVLGFFIVYDRRLLKHCGNLQCL